MSDDEDLHRGDDAATALSPEEKVGLIPTWIVTRDDLNRAERANIAAGLRRARRGRFDVLNADQLMTLHRRMYGDVWRWAGQTRQSEKNIGRGDWWALREHLHQLLGNIAAEVEYKARDPDEIAIDADSDDAAQLFRDDLARCSDLMPPSGMAIVDRSDLGRVWPVGQACSAGFGRRRESPLRSRRWALCTSRSRMASA